MNNYSRDFLFLWRLFSFVKIHIIHFSDLFALSTFLWFYRLFRHHNISRHKTENSIRSKSSDTLFILASGNSLSQLSASQWKLIHSKDIFTFNFGYLLNVIPTYYMCELSTDNILGSKFIYHIIDDLNRLLPVLTSTDFIFKPRYPNIFRSIISLIDISNRFGASFCFLLNIWSPSASLKLASNKYSFLRSLSHRLPYPFPSENYILKGSLEQAVSFGISHNYTNIVICGADLGGTYFYDSSPSLIRPGFKPPSYNQYSDRSNPALHRTNDSSVHPVTITDTIKLLFQTSKALNISISVSDSSSPLSSFLPVYDWNCS